ncbi:hypothetical protein [Arhodomonas sp. KWT]|uniref:hypothetical protein n=1 Tax=Arhodomonas sp. KWT TaxID=2679915 RepID=UPI0013D5F847|nr:hypothetical protein [Arhodomonas sp. KWT]
MGKALRGLRERIEAIDDELDRLLAEREAIRSAPVTREEAIAELDRTLAEWAERGRREVRSQVNRLAAGADFEVEKLFREPAREGWTPAVEPLAALLGDRIREAAVAEIEASNRYRDDALPADQRRQRIAEIDQKADALEAERRTLIDEMRAAGFDVQEVDETPPPAPFQGEVIEARTEGRKLDEAERASLDASDERNAVPEPDLDADPVDHFLTVEPPPKGSDRE